MLQVEAMPIWGLAKSLSVKPTAYSMARLGARSMPSTTWDENGRVSLLLLLTLRVSGTI
jgi:hypothetical protein